MFRKIIRYSICLFALATSNVVFAQDVDSEQTLTITNQPAFITIAKRDASVTLTCTAETANASSVKYQWHINTENSKTGGTPIEGATSSEYTTQPFTEKEIRFYYCEVTDNEESVTSDVAVVAYTGLPLLHVETPDHVEIMSKELWTEGTMLTLTNCPDDSWNFENISASFRGRGNTTWGLEKKPYAIKLDSKRDVMGMPKHKRWVLIANYLDNSFLKNHLAFCLSERFDMDYTVKGQFVDLIFNGVYRGMYWLGEAIKVDKNRVNIDDGSEDMTDDEDKDYLIEMDVYYDEPVRFMTSKRQLPCMIKNDDYIVDENGQMTSGGFARLERLQGKVNGLESLLYPGYVYGMDINDCAAPDEKYTEIIDLDSWAKYWIINEIMGNVDLGWPKSAYFTYNSTTGVLKAGPVWDFDYSSLERYDGINLSRAVYYNALFKSPSFVSALESVWENYSSQADITTEVEKMQEYLRVAAGVDRLKWGEHLDPVETTSKGDFDAYVDYLQAAVERKIDLVDDFVESLPQTTSTGKFYGATAKSGVKVWVRKGRLFVSSAQGQEYAIFDLLGQTLMKGVFSSDYEEIDLGRFGNSVYVVRVGCRHYKVAQ